MLNNYFLMTATNMELMYLVIGVFLVDTIIFKTIAFINKKINKKGYSELREIMKQKGAAEDITKQSKISMKAYPIYFKIQIPAMLIQLTLFILTFIYIYPIFITNIPKLSFLIVFIIYSKAVKYVYNMLKSRKSTLSLKKKTI